VKSNVIRSSDVSRCPIASLAAGHYRPDGSCRCDEEMMKEPTMDELYELPLLTADEVAVLRHGLRRMVPDVPGSLPTIAADDLVGIARSLDTALAEATRRG
jgi:hypothetical protein